jgi:hypothetical protein
MTAGESGSYERVQLNPTDRFGREIDPAVLKAAEQLGQRVFGYGERMLGDPAVVASAKDDPAFTTQPPSMTSLIPARKRSP